MGVAVYQYDDHQHCNGCNAYGPPDWFIDKNYQQRSNCDDQWKCLENDVLILHRCFLGPAYFGLHESRCIAFKGLREAFNSFLIGINQPCSNN